jgi:hypothetical protein
VGAPADLFSATGSNYRNAVTMNSKSQTIPPAFTVADEMTPKTGHGLSPEVRCAPIVTQWSRKRRRPTMPSQVLR